MRVQMQNAAVFAGGALPGQRAVGAGFAEGDSTGCGDAVDDAVRAGRYASRFVDDEIVEGETVFDGWTQRCRLDDGGVAVCGEVGAQVTCAGCAVAQHFSRTVVTVEQPQPDDGFVVVVPRSFGADIGGCNSTAGCHCYTSPVN